MSSNSEVSPVVSEAAEPDRREQMRAQIQSVAHDGAVQIDQRREHRRPLESTGEYIAMLEAKVERIANIAEAGEPDEDWATISGEFEAAHDVFDALDEGDPRRDEDNQAMLDAARKP